MHRDHTSDPAVFNDEILHRHGGNPVAQAPGQGVLIQRVPQPTTATGRSMPAWHTVAFLLIEAVPLHAAFDGPLVEVGMRVFDIEARPCLICGPLTPGHPVLEGQIRRVVDAMLALQSRANAATVTARNGG